MITRQNIVSYFNGRHGAVGSDCPPEKSVFPIAQEGDEEHFYVVLKKTLHMEDVAETLQNFVTGIPGVRFVPTVKEDSVVVTFYPPSDLVQILFVKDLNAEKGFFVTLKK